MTQLVEFNTTFLEKSYQWLNDDYVCDMLNCNHVTKEEQDKWYSNLKSDSNYLIWGISYNSIPVGACGLKSRNNVTSLFCYIGEKNYFGKGIGTQALTLLFEKAKIKKIKKIELSVQKRNVRAVKLYSKLGFTVKEEDKERYYMNIEL